MKRKARQVNKTFICKDHTSERFVTTKLSVRNELMAIYVSGGDEWPHFDLKQTKKLIAFMEEAVIEIEKRAENRGWVI